MQRSRSVPAEVADSFCCVRAGRGAEPQGLRRRGRPPAANSNRASDGSAGAGPGLRALLGPGAILGWMARRVPAGPERSPGPARGAGAASGAGAARPGQAPARRWRAGPGSAGCKQ